MQKLKQLIANYQAVCPQEVGDQKQMLQFLDLFDNLLTRENTIAHFSSSGFIVNKAHTKTLFIHHKIYQTWCWTGGHVDGNSNFIEVALKEGQEETGLLQLVTLSKEIASLDILPVYGHFKKGIWVPAHQHLSLAYVLEADESAPLIHNKGETNGIKWVPFDDINQVSGESELFPVYQKLIHFTRNR